MIWIMFDNLTFNKFLKHTSIYLEVVHESVQFVKIRIYCKRWRIVGTLNLNKVGLCRSTALTAARPTLFRLHPVEKHTSSNLPCFFNLMLFSCDRNTFLRVQVWPCNWRNIGHQRQEALGEMFFVITLFHYPSWD